MMLSLLRFCFYCFVVFVPFGIGFLIDTHSSLGLNFFNPYLSQKLYLSDVFWLLGVFCLGVGVLFGRLKLDFDRKKHFTFLVFSCAVLLACLISVLSSFDNFVALVYFFRVIEFLVFSWLIVLNVLPVKKVLYIFIFLLGGLALLGILQFVLQHSIGLHFLGEPVISVAQPGVAKVEIFGHQLLRAYGTFSHPNVFGGYLVMAILGVFYLKSIRFRKILISICLLALILTFSRSALLALLLFVFFKSNLRFKFLYVGIFLFCFFVLFFDFSELAVSERLEYMRISKEMFFSYPFGVGGGNFTFVMPQFSSLVLMPWQLQPVHNIFLLFLNEWGIVGFLLIIGAVINCISAVWKKHQNLQNIGAMMVLIFILGMFDHYLISLYQGQLILALMLQPKLFDSRL